MVELLILGLLKEVPLHGYELKKRIENIVGYFGSVSYGSLYPMLRKLEERGHVTKSINDQTGPSRIVYQITFEGEARFMELMQDPGAPFSLKMLLIHSIQPSERMQLLEQQQNEWVHKLKERRRDQERIAERYIHRYRAALLTRSMEHLERDIVWIQNLIQEEGHL